MSSHTLQKFLPGVALILMFFLAACQPEVTKLTFTPVPEETITAVALSSTTATTIPVHTLARLEEALRATGLEVQMVDSSPPQSLTPLIQNLRVNKEFVAVREYADMETADAEAGWIDLSGDAIAQPNPADPGTDITVVYEWVATPHWYHNENLIVFYAGDTQAILNGLEMVLGPQIAGRETLYPTDTVPMPTATAAAPSESLLDSPIISPPPGLIYSEIDNGIWQIDAQSQPRLLTSRVDALVSPDGRHAAYMDEDRQLRMINTGDSSERPLAGDYELSNFMVWGDNSTLLVGVWLSPDETEGPNNGHVAALDIASGDVQILDPDNLSGNRPALAPDGLTVAFDTFQGGSQIYPADGRLQPFDPAEFAALNEMQSAMLFNPAWSPDIPTGEIAETRLGWAPRTRDPKLAWLNAGGERVAVQVYDLTRLTAVQLFDWDPARFGALIPSPVWSPDGQWLALEVWANNTEDNGLWLLAADGSRRIHLDDSAGSPFWYNAAQLVYWNYDENRNGPIEMYDWTNDKTYVIEMPANSMLAGLTPAMDLSPEPSVQPSAAALPFEAATFRSDPFAFEFDYPADWTISDLGAIGSRGSATQFLEGDRVAMQMTFYLWDPQNDLAAYIDNRKIAWKASGMTVLAEENWLLDTDHPAASFVVQGQGGEKAYFFYTTIADRYLELSGDQELDLLATIAGTMRL